MIYLMSTQESSIAPCCLINFCGTQIDCPKATCVGQCPKATTCGVN